MSGNGRWLAVAIIVLCAMPAVARADMDYRCLNDCLRNGSPGSKCMANCTYDTAPPPAAGVSPERLVTTPQSAHSQFTAPEPLNAIIIGPEGGPQQPPAVTPQQALSPTVRPLGPSTDYKCLRDCQARGYQPGLCAASCSY